MNLSLVFWFVVFRGLMVFFGGGGEILVSWSFLVIEVPSQLFHEDDVLFFSSLGHLPLYSMASKLGLYI